MDMLQFLESKGYDLKRSGQTDEYIMQCPQCGKRKLSVNNMKQKWQCWRCATGGGFEFLCKFLGIPLDQKLNPDFRKLRQRLQTTPVTLSGTMELPKGFIALRRHRASFFQKKAYDYLNGRGITDEMIERWALGYCTDGEYAEYIIIPVPDETNQIRTFQARRFFGVGMKSKNPPGADKYIFNTNYAKGHPGLIVVEGPFDAMVTHSRMSKPKSVSAIALLGHTCSPLQAKIIASCRPKKLWIALDPDISFEEANKMGGTFRAEGVENVNICTLPRDPDELTEDDWWGDVLPKSKQCHYRKINYGKI